MVTTTARRLVSTAAPARHARDPAPLDHDRLDHLLAERQVLLPLDRELGEELVGLLVALGPRAVHRRPFAAVEQAELDGRRVGEDAHRAAEGVDLADDLPLGHAADRRVAAHLADGVAVDRQQRGPQAHPRRGQRGLEPGVAGADDDDVEIDRGRASCMVSAVSSDRDPAIGRSTSRRDPSIDPNRPAIALPGRTGGTRPERSAGWPLATGHRPLLP